MPIAESVTVAVASRGLPHPMQCDIYPAFGDPGACVLFNPKFCIFLFDHEQIECHHVPTDDYLLERLARYAEEALRHRTG